MFLYFDLNLSRHLAPTYSLTPYSSPITTDYSSYSSYPSIEPYSGYHNFHSDITFDHSDHHLHDDHHHYSDHISHEHPHESNFPPPDSSMPAHNNNEVNSESQSNTPVSSETYRRVGRQRRQTKPNIQ